MMNLEPEYVEEIKAIVEKITPGYEIRIFGSRVQGSEQPFSDVDVALKGESPLDAETMTALKDAFSESDIPYIIDIADWNRLPQSIRNQPHFRFERV